ncbi:Phenylacetic acid catabolic protein [Novosphingobium sp. THN1]|nr:Phenylacetic acid catabolic protein [Novosphingobium sp. THN1]
MDHSLFRALTQLGDDSLILGQRLCEWCGHAPRSRWTLACRTLRLT